MNVWRWLPRSVLLLCTFVLMVLAFSCGPPSEPCFGVDCGPHVYRCRQECPKLDRPCLQQCLRKQPVLMATCSEQVVDLLSDPLHCGQCGQLCAGGRRCFLGSCACTADQVTCPNRGCVTSDEKNCSACGDVCKDGFSCAQRKCQCPAPTHILCNGKCVKQDHNNCGACGVTCGAPSRCVPGTGCVCADRYIKCSDGSCVPQDDRNCGACGKKCAPEERCAFSRCVLAQGLRQCNGLWVDTSSDRQHCGRCGVRCADSQVCRQANCVCALGRRACGARCVSLQTDDKHCGGCNKACPLGWKCIAGRCRTSCTPRLLKSPMHSSLNISITNMWLLGGGKTLVSLHQKSRLYFSHLERLMSFESFPSCTFDTRRASIRALALTNGLLWISCESQSRPGSWRLTAFDTKRKRPINTIELFSDIRFRLDRGIILGLPPSRRELRGYRSLFSSSSAFGSRLLQRFAVSLPFRATRMLLSPHNLWVWLDGDSQTAQIRDTITGRLLSSLVLGTRSPRQVAFVPGTDQVVLGFNGQNQKGRIELWNWRTKKGIRSWEVPLPFRFEIAEDGKSMWLWDARGNLSSYTLALGSKLWNLALLKTSQIPLAAWRHDRRQLAVAHPDFSISIWDMTTRKLLVRHRGHKSPIQKLAWLANQYGLLSLDQKGRLLHWGCCKSGEHWCEETCTQQNQTLCP